MPNYLLYNGVNTKAVTVINAAGLHGFATRGSLETSLNEVGWLRGDAVDVVTPISCRLLITAATESAALTELRAIATFAENAEYLRRTDQAAWRALHGSGLSLQSFDPNLKESASSDTWEGEITLMPLFSLWTETQVRTLAGYDAASKSP